MGINEVNEFKLLVRDPDANDTHIVSLSGAPFATLLPLGKGHYLVRLKPTMKEFGGYELRFTATDNYNNETKIGFSLTVTVPNASPVLTVPGEQTVKVGETLTFKVSATDSDTEQVVQLLGGGISGSTFSTTSPANPVFGTFTWTPDATQVGTYESFWLMYRWRAAGRIRA